MTQEEIKRLEELRKSIDGVHFYEFYACRNDCPMISKRANAVYSTVEKHLADALNLLNEILEKQNL